MSLRDKLDVYVQKTFDWQWERRAGQKVQTPMTFH